MTKSPPRNAIHGEEVPDSEEEDESITDDRADEEATTATSSTPSKPTQAIPRALKDERQALSTTATATSSRATSLEEKIRLLRSSIEHTRDQLGEALGKIPDDEETQSDATSRRKPSGLKTYPMSALSPEQEQSLLRAQNILDRHIKQLGKYNQLKDIAMGMLGIIAEREGKTMRETMAARDIEDDD